MTHKNKQRGDRAEYQVKERFGQIPEVHCTRIGLSLQAGAGAGVVGDLSVTWPGMEDFRGEVKCRKSNRGYEQLRKWLALHDFLALKLEGEIEPLVVIPWRVMDYLVRESVLAEKLRNESPVPNNVEPAVCTEVDLLERSTEAE